MMNSILNTVSWLVTLPKLAQRYFYIQSTYLMLLSLVFLCQPFLAYNSVGYLRERLELQGATWHQGKEAVFIAGARLEPET